MHHDLLPRLCCPACRQALCLTPRVGDNLRTHQGHLQCGRCGIVTPVIDGFVLFTEPLLHAGLASPAALAALGQRLFGSAAEFHTLARTRQARGALEVYAAFQPFNESMRSIEPLAPWLAPLLPAGMPVVDLWCRTGWSAEWLAGRFPDSPVLALWEGAHSVLGYRGWRHRLGAGQRAANLDVVFADPRQPLPLADTSFGLVYSHDLLHRYGWQPLAGESLRIARHDGAIVHSHLHLSNRQPEPFFERGCHQQHGRDYRAWLDAVQAAAAARGHPRQAFVLGEATLFDGPPVARLHDTPDTGDCNGLVLVLPAHAVSLAPAAPDPVPAGHRLLPNPLLQWSLLRSEVRPDPTALGGGAPQLLSHHPRYAARLPAALALSATDWALATLAAAGRTVGELRAASADPTQAGGRLQGLAHAEVLRPVPVGPGALALQWAHAGLSAGDGAEGTEGAGLHPLVGLLNAWAGPRAHDVVLELGDGDALTGHDALLLVAALQCWAHARVVDAVGAAAATTNTATATATATAELCGSEPLLVLVALALASGGVDVGWASGARGAPGTVTLRPAGTAAQALPQVLPLGADGAPDGLLACALALADGRPAQAQWQRQLRFDDAGMTAPLGDWVRGAVALAGLTGPVDAAARVAPSAADAGGGPVVWLACWTRWARRQGPAV